MPSYIVPAAGQKLDPVVRRLVGYAKQVGEQVRIDRSTPRPRLEVGPKTLERWRETNRSRLATDRAAHADVIERRTSGTSGKQRATSRKRAASAPAPPVPAAAEPAPAPAGLDKAASEVVKPESPLKPSPDAAADTAPEPVRTERSDGMPRPVKKTVRKRKSTRKTTGDQAGTGQ